MKTKTIDVYLHHRVGEDWEAVFSAENMGDMGYVLVGRGTATFNMVEQAEIVNAQIDALTAAKTELLAKTNIQLAELDAKIQNLLAITHDGGEA